MFTNEDVTQSCCKKETELEVSAVEAEDESTTDESITEATVVEDDLQCRQCVDQGSRYFHPPLPPYYFAKILPQLVFNNPRGYQSPMLRAPGYLQGVRGCR